VGSAALGCPPSEARPAPARHRMTFVIFPVHFLFTQSPDLLLIFSQRSPHVGMRRTSKTMLRITSCLPLLAVLSLGHAAAQKSKTTLSKPSCW